MGVAATSEGEATGRVCTIAAPRGGPPRIRRDTWFHCAVCNQGISCVHVGIFFFVVFVHCASDDRFSAEYLRASGTALDFNSMCAIVKILCVHVNTFSPVMLVVCKPFFAPHQPLRFCILVSLPFASSPPRFTNTHLNESHLLLQST